MVYACVVCAVRELFLLLGYFCLFNICTKWVAMSCRHVRLLSGLIEYFLNIFGTSMSMSLSVSLSVSVSPLTSVFGAIRLPHPRLLSTCHISHDACHSLPRTTLCFIHCCCYWRCCCCYCNLYVLFILCQFNATLTLTHSLTHTLTHTHLHSHIAARKRKQTSRDLTDDSKYVNEYVCFPFLSLSPSDTLSRSVLLCVCASVT